MGSGCSPGDCACLAQAGEMVLQPKAFIEDIAEKVDEFDTAVDGMNKASSGLRLRRREPPDRNGKLRSSARIRSGRRGAGRARGSSRIISLPQDRSYGHQIPRPTGQLVGQYDPPIERWRGTESPDSTGPWRSMLGNRAPVNVLYANNQIYQSREQPPAPAPAPLSALLSPPARTLDQYNQTKNPLFFRMPDVPTDLSA